MEYESKLQNAIRVNQRGFLKYSKKRFVLIENKTQDKTFSVVLTDNVEEKTVFVGEMVEYTENGKTVYEGDFSSLDRDGDYFILAGGFKSRQFVIYDHAYDICQRTMLGYFTLQRCGHPLGWNGACHLDDGFIKETGEHIDLSGGYHQSCDLRKSPGGVSIGVSAMMNFALKDKSQWGKILVSDEVRWACDYFVKTIQDMGAMYNTLNEPFGWEGRVFYKSDAPSSAQWNVTSILAKGSKYFEKTDTSRAKLYLDTARRSFSYLTSDKRKNEVYKHPDKYPVGMDPDFFYDQCKGGETADLCYLVTASADLYRATGNEAYLLEIDKAIPKILESLRGFLLFRKDDSERLVTASCSYTWIMGGLFALCDGYELLGDKHELKLKIRLALQEIGKFASKSVWKTTQLIYSGKDLDQECGHEGKTKRECIGALAEYSGLYYSQDYVFEPSYDCYLGIFIARASKLLKEYSYMEYAQYIADNLLGGNMLDSSRIQGIGYNQAPHYSYGQFFPSTPFIPGAVGVGYSELDVYRITSEYDMPCVGLAMNLLSELSN